VDQETAERPAGLRNAADGPLIQTLPSVGYHNTAPYLDVQGSTAIIGIDPGAHGAIPLLDGSGELVSIEDMLTTTDASGRTITVVVLTPLMWKRLADLPPGAEHKDVARTRAIAKWLAHAGLFRRKADVDRAEAALIALAGLKREPRNV
jgi:hypothetical protein